MSVEISPRNSFQSPYADAHIKKVKCAILLLGIGGVLIFLFKALST